MKDKRTEKIQLRLTPAEWGTLNLVAERHHLPLSTWVRSTAVMAAASQLEMMKAGVGS